MRDLEEYIPARWDCAWDLLCVNRVNSSVYRTGRGTERGFCDDKERGNGSLPTCFHVLLEVGGYKAAAFLYLVHDVGLIHHVPLTERNKFFKMIRKQFPANVKSERRGGGGQSKIGLENGHFKFNGG